LRAIDKIITGFIIYIIGLYGYLADDNSPNMHYDILLGNFLPHYLFFLIFFFIKGNIISYYSIFNVLYNRIRCFALLFRL